MDDTYPNGIPQATDVAAVQTYIDSVRPTTADVIVMAPTLHGIDVVVSTSDAALTLGRQAGVIAQEVQALAASTGYGDWLVSKSPSGKLAVDYQSLAMIVAKGNQLRLAALEAAADATALAKALADVEAANNAADSKATAALPAISQPVQATSST